MPRLGETWLPKPIRGVWPVSGLPPVILLSDESSPLGVRRYLKARWKQSYPGVVEQYREDVARDSRHLKVMTDGTFLIDHVDEFNPDAGYPVSHFLADHPLAKLGYVLACMMAAARR